MGTITKEKESEKKEQVVACLQFLKTIEKPKTTELISIATSSDSSRVEKVTTERDTNKNEEGGEISSREQTNVQETRQREDMSIE